MNAVDVLIGAVIGNVAMALRGVLLKGAEVNREEDSKAIQLACVRIEKIERLGIEYWSSSAQSLGNRNKEIEELIKHCFRKLGTSIVSLKHLSPDFEEAFLTFKQIIQLDDFESSNRNGNLEIAGIQIPNAAENFINLIHNSYRERYRKFVSFHIRNACSYIKNFFND